MREKAFNITVSETSTRCCVCSLFDNPSLFLTFRPQLVLDTYKKLGKPVLRSGGVNASAKGKSEFLSALPSPVTELRVVVQRVLINLPNSLEETKPERKRSLSDCETEEDDELITCASCGICVHKCELMGIGTLSYLVTWSTPTSSPSLLWCSILHLHQPVGLSAVSSWSESYPRLLPLPPTWRSTETHWWRTLGTPCVCCYHSRCLSRRSAQQGTRCHWRYNSSSSQASKRETWAVIELFVCLLCLALFAVCECFRRSSSARPWHLHSVHSTKVLYCHACHLCSVSWIASRNFALWKLWFPLSETLGVCSRVECKFLEWWWLVYFSVQIKKQELKKGKMCMC